MSVPYALFSASGTPGPQGPAGVLAPGSAAGNTPFWNGSAWVTNNSNLYNNGGNIGIATTTPGFPLNFPNTIDDKISLYGNSGNHYGFGIQGGLLQMHTDAALANIAFGYGSSSSFTEGARIINSGSEGMILYGRLHLKNGSAPINVTQSVGIGNENPNAPLSFAASLGKKITLYPGATGDVGFGVSGNRLQIYSDNPNADVGFMFTAYNLRRIINILGINLLKEYLRILISIFLSIIHYSRPKINNFQTTFFGCQPRIKNLRNI